ncbi:MAG: hypothetical protein GXO74_11175 [Calditrichaeota bacterium]|nr:hypothetical protein [Calditrichota bacterium]
MNHQNKRLMRWAAISITMLLLSLFAFHACQMDHGLSPKEYQIKGKVQFFKGNPPEGTDRIEVFALKEFPPQNPQNLLYLGRSGPLDYQSGREVSYSIDVSPTTYQFVGVIWKEKGKDWNLTGLMGFYTGSENTFSFFPDSVVVSKEQPIVEDVNFTANWELVNKDARISGKIYYEGHWPEDTNLLLLAVYPQKPQSDFEYLTFSNIDYSQPIFVDSSRYELPINSGVYQYVALFWVGKSISSLSDMVALGFFEDKNNPGLPGRIEIQTGQTLENIDIHVNFNEIQFPKIMPRSNSPEDVR